VSPSESMQRLCTVLQATARETQAWADARLYESFGETLRRAFGSVFDKAEGPFLVTAFKREMRAEADGLLYTFLLSWPEGVDMRLDQAMVTMRSIFGLGLETDPRRGKDLRIYFEPARGIPADLLGGPWWSGVAARAELAEPRTKEILRVMREETQAEIAQVRTHMDGAAARWTTRWGNGSSAAGGHGGHG
jgi:hypothetical protein